MRNDILLHLQEGHRDHAYGEDKSQNTTQHRPQQEQHGDEVNNAIATFSKHDAPSYPNLVNV